MALYFRSHFHLHCPLFIFLLNFFLPSPYIIKFDCEIFLIYIIQVKLFKNVKGQTLSLKSFLIFFFRSLSHSNIIIMCKQLKGVCPHFFFLKQWFSFVSIDFYLWRIQQIIKEKEREREIVEQFQSFLRQYYIED